MSPLPAIPQTMPVYSFAPHADVAPVETTPLKAPDILFPSGPGQPAEIASAQPVADSFASMLGRMVADVNARQRAATEAVNALQSGRDVPLHQVIIAMEEASLSFQLMVEVRNKLLESYQEIMRMQI
jgi:flagellar hook-basal body complex protein FliE